MAIIYSRPRLKIPKFLYIKINKKNSIFIKVIIIITIIISIINSATPKINEICVDKARSMTNVIFNEQSSKVLNEYNYSDFIIIHKDAYGKVLMLEANMVNMNKLISDIVSNIQNEVNNTKSKEILINIGTITGIGFLYGKGKELKIKLSSIGTLETDIKSEFISQGVNQTLHRLYLDIKCKISIVTPFTTELEENVSTQVIIAENLIIGDIPETYYNLIGLENGEAMEMME